MRYIGFLCLLCCSWLLLGQVVAQPLAVIRTLNRVDLSERQNKPLLGTAASGNQSLAQQGLIRALMTGLEQGKFPAYDPDRPGQTMRWPVVQARVAALNPQTTAYTDQREALEGLEEAETATASPPIAAGWSACEQVFQFVADEATVPYSEEKTFKIRYIEVIWVDPAGVLPERKLCAFRYEDILPLLDQVQWHNPYNDAETRSLREAFDLRLFRSYAIQMSGKPIQTLDESQRKSGQLIQYEHNLWQN